MISRYDNRGIGESSRPTGLYTSSLLAEDLYWLLIELQIPACHMLGISMGGMVAQTYAFEYPNNIEGLDSNPQLLSLTLACTYARPSPFCTRMFKFWAETAMNMSVQHVMKDVLLWAFTVPFFLERKKELKEVENGMKNLDMGTPEYLAQLNVIQTFDSRSTLRELSKKGMGLGGLSGAKIMVLAGEEDILIPVVLSKELHDLMPGAVWKTCRGGHAACWEFPDEFNKAYLDFLAGL